MNLWYEKIDYLLHPGMKEAFCYAVGEAMAKGIKPVINKFLGSEDIWDGEFTYSTHAEAVNRFQSREFITKIKPNILYRQYIEKNYDVKRQLKETDEFLGL